jgi:proline racemase
MDTEIGSEAHDALVKLADRAQDEAISDILRGYASEIKCSLSRLDDDDSWAEMLSF